MLRGKILNRTKNIKTDLFEREQNIRCNLLSVPNDLDELEELAMILFYKKDCEGALELWDKLYKSGKKNEISIGFLGYLNYELGNYSDSIKFFNKFLDESPQDSFVHFLLGNAYSRIGKIIEAINSYDFSIFLGLDMYKTHLDFAKEYEALGRYSKALVEYIAAFEIDPRDKKIKKKILELKENIDENKNN